MCRRRSPSVMMPTSRPPASTTPTTPKPLRLISISASGIGASGADQRHLVAGVHQVADLGEPRARAGRRGAGRGSPPGVNARCSISATASASPSASVIVVEVVGASPTEQASGAGGSTMRDVGLAEQRALGPPGDPDQRDARSAGYRR